MKNRTNASRSRFALLVLLTVAFLVSTILYTVTTTTVSREAIDDGDRSPSKDESEQTPTHNDPTTPQQQRAKTGDDEEQIVRFTDTKPSTTSTYFGENGNNNVCGSHHYIPGEGRQQTTTEKVLNFNPLYPWFGLSNQMSSYAAATRYAFSENRSVLFPDHHSEDGKRNLVDFHLLFNASLYFKLLQETIRASPSTSQLVKLQTRFLKMAWREDFTPSVEEVRKTSAAAFAAKTRNRKLKPSLPLSLPSSSSSQQETKVSATTTQPSSYFYTPQEFPSSLYPRDPSLFTFVPPSAFPFTSMNKKNLFLPNRDVSRVNLFSSSSSSSSSRVASPMTNNNNNNNNLIRSTQRHMERIANKSAKYQYIRHHNFYMRYPWVLSASLPSVLHESHFLNTLHPVDVVEEYWSGICHRLKTLVTGRGKANKSTSTLHHYNSDDSDDDDACATWFHENVISLHLRLEPDAVLLSKKLPSVDSVITWMKEHVFPRVVGRKEEKQQGRTNSSSLSLSSTKTIIIYICIGQWPSREFEDKMHEFAEGLVYEGVNIELWWRDRILLKVEEKHNRNGKNGKLKALPKLPRIIGKQRGTHSNHQKSAMLKVKSTQDHYLSFVDFLSLVRSKDTVLSLYSSLKFPVYSRRCYYSSSSTSSDHQEEQQQLLLEPEVKRVLECWLPLRQRVEWSSRRGQRNRIFVYNVDEKNNGKISGLEEISCEERSKSGWAGHRSWN